MTRARLLLATVIAAAAGGAIGFATRGTDAARGARPKAVAEVLRALERADKGESAPLAAALRAAGDASSYDAPWRDELLLASSPSEATSTRSGASPRADPASAPRARAWVWIGAHARDAAERARAGERLRADYPDSWLHAVPPPEGGR